MQSIRLLQLASRDLGQTLIIVESYYVSIYLYFVFYFTARIPHSAPGRGTFNHV